MVKIFDDWRSVLHFLAPIPLVVKPVLLLTVTILFICIELAEKEDFDTFAGDLIEWCLGVYTGFALILLFKFFI